MDVRTCQSLEQFMLLFMVLLVLLVNGSVVILTNDFPSQSLSKFQYGVFDSGQSRVELDATLLLDYTCQRSSPHFCWVAERIHRARDSKHLFSSEVRSETFLALSHSTSTKPVPSTAQHNVSYICTFVTFKKPGASGTL